MRMWIWPSFTQEKHSAKVFCTLAKAVFNHDCDLWLGKVIDITCENCAISCGCGYCPSVQTHNRIARGLHLCPLHRSITDVCVQQPVCAMSYYFSSEPQMSFVALSNVLPKPKQPPLVWVTHWRKFGLATASHDETMLVFYTLLIIKWQVNNLLNFLPGYLNKAYWPLVPWVLTGEMYEGWFLPCYTTSFFLWVTEKSVLIVWVMMEGNRFLDPLFILNGLF